MLYSSYRVSLLAVPPGGKPTLTLVPAEVREGCVRVRNEGPGPVTVSLAVSEDGEGYTMLANRTVIVSPDKYVDLKFSGAQWVRLHFVAATGAHALLRWRTANLTTARAQKKLKMSRRKR